MIDRFEGEYRFLSNFWPCRVKLDGDTYPSVEHAYQASKTHDRTERHVILLASTPGKAKRLGGNVTLCQYHQYAKVEIMLGLLRQKFAYDDLRQMLLSTKEHFLIEGNAWGDTFWGVCDGRGLNRLGQLLMQVRTELLALA